LAFLLLFWSLLPAGTAWAEDTVAPPEPPPATLEEIAKSMSVTPTDPVVRDGAYDTTGLPDAAAQKEETKTSYNAGPVSDIQSNTRVASLSTEPTDFNFNNTPILNILKTFSLRFGVNIIPSDAVGGKVTLYLKQVPFDEAFQILLDKMDLVAIQRSKDIIQVMKKREMPLSRQTFPLKNRLAGEVKATLEALLTAPERDRLIIAVDNASNSLIVTANTAQVNRLGQLIEQLDVKRPQVRIKTRIIEVQDDDFLSIGVSWGGARARGGVTTRVGKDVGTLNTFAANGITPTPTLIGETFGEGGFFDISQIMDHSALYAVLNLLAANTRTKTLSEPSIMTGNDRTARIHVGKNLPVKTVQVTQTAQIQSISYIKEGIDLEVTPVLSPGSKQISMKVQINVSEFTGFQNDSPITTERSAFTEIVLESGKSVAIGGLIREITQKNVSGIPLLKDIPLLGALFRSTQNSNNKTNLLILITPELVQD